MIKRTRAKGLRITGGVLRGRRVEVAPGTRPTQERVREALFSRWQGQLLDASILELFCGGGVITLEALSRGVKHGFLVDCSAQSLRVVARNLATLGLDAECLQAELPSQWHRLPKYWPQGFDFIYVDPPYAMEALTAVLEVASSRLGAEGELALEHDVRREVAVPKGLELAGQRRYGETALSFYRLPSQRAMH